MRSHITTHVLDSARGLPAAGVAVTLADAAGTVLASAVTDSDGRVSELGPAHLDPGVYALAFATGAYYAAAGMATFYPVVSVTFAVEATDSGHAHVPLLLSPFAYSTYRGS